MISVVFASEIAAGLTHRSATFRLAGLWDLGWAGIDDPALVPAVCRCLDDPDAGVRAEAARALVGFGAGTVPAVPRLLEIVRNEMETWPCALPTLVALRADPLVVVLEVARLLARRPDHAGLLAGALRAYGADAGPAIPALLDALGREVTRGVAVREVLAAVRTLAADPEARVREHFTADPELWRHVLWELSQPIE